MVLRVKAETEEKGIGGDLNLDLALQTTQLELQLVK